MAGESPTKLEVSWENLRTMGDVQLLYMFDDGGYISEQIVHLRGNPENGTPVPIPDLSSMGGAWETYGNGRSHHWGYQQTA